ncbi:sulfatase [Pirellula staleyi DSM 6068]|uniref:Sulfatase n=1 Tax=Pirellula staleyi (strain ATCC 27377 / DSM 6068 / ICPB 4128) TaxID=530564 RepID=D2R201_PIRSD|nr:sulfatase [Pirellula staleyi]ADB18612.1 sulfatase [Pirellula staleyi DSM 6068]
MLHDVRWSIRVAWVLSAVAYSLTPGWTLASDANISTPKKRPHILFIAIDDQNDWIGHLGGHPYAKTPHLDALAARGTTLANAHCQAPLCNPSRTSLMFGLRPTSTGIYGLAPWIRTLPEFEKRVSLPQYLQQHGYRTLTTGKIYHGGLGPKKRLEEFDVWGPAGGIGAKPEKKLIPPTPMGNHPLMDWGKFDHRDEDKGDYQITSWAIEQLDDQVQHHAETPMFLSVGYFLPHVPCFISPKWYDEVPQGDKLLPLVAADDRSDIPRFAWYLHWSLPEPRLKWVEDHRQWENLVRSYLASTTFVDAQIGRLLTALEERKLADDTIVVVWGDHGWHLGEKGITGKNTLWERSTRVPLIFAGPGITPKQVCGEPAELLDIFPTLVELAGLPPRNDLEGHSLAPQLRDASRQREWPAITSHNQGNHAIRSARYRYITYADGSEELYDMQSDPRELTNLASDSTWASVIADHRRWLPKMDREPAKGSAHRVLTYDKATDTATWEGTPVKRSDPIPQ